MRKLKKDRQHNWKEQRSTKHTHKTKDRVTRTPRKSGVNSGALRLPVFVYAPVSH